MKRVIAVGCMVAVATSTILQVSGETLCMGESPEVKIDLMTGTRTVTVSELIRYSAGWQDGVPAGAVAVVEVNGEALDTAEGSGFVEWTPRDYGTYTLTHKIMSGGIQYSETLTATFIVKSFICSNESASVKIDLTPGARTTTTTEQIRYSTGWETDAPSGATAVVEVNGTMLSSVPGVGFVEWIPMSNGTYTLTHRVMSDEIQHGETLTATFVVAEMPNAVTATQTTDVPVPYTWLKQHCPNVADEYAAYEASAKASAANGRKVWECYVLGLDPEVATNDFKIVSFPLKADGTPDLEHIVFVPPQARWNVPATYKVKGAATLQGPWREVPAGGNPAYRFFKVEVVLP